jgi:hypothetical protein
MLPMVGMDPPMLFSLPCGSSGSLATTILGFFSAARCFVLIAAFSLLDRSRLRRKEHFCRTSRVLRLTLLAPDIVRPSWRVGSLVVSRS